MQIVQEYPITASGSLQVSLPDGSNVLQAVTIGASSKLRVVIDPAAPTKPVTFSVVPTGSAIGGTPTTWAWFGQIVLGQQTCDVFRIF
jgi:hypothetical protein